MKSNYDFIYNFTLDQFIDRCRAAGATQPDLIRQLASDKNIGNSSAVTELRQRWYRSLQKNDPDYSVYSAEEFLAETWFCWTHYSKKYLRALGTVEAVHGHSVFADLGTVDVILDLGCGVGLTTALLKIVFPEARVIGTNFPGSIQTRVAEGFARDLGFEILPESPDLESVGLVFASEYFEHIINPVEHLRDLVKRTNPGAFVIANAFNTESVGHFLEYIDGIHVIPQTDISKLFNTGLRQAGYQKIKTPFWNQRPTYWKRSTQGLLW